MPGRGLEPLRIAPPDPKSGASANFATLADKSQDRTDDASLLRPVPIVRRQFIAVRNSRNRGQAASGRGRSFVLEAQLVRFSGQVSLGNGR